MAFTIISLLILAYALIHFKKGFMVFILYHIIWYSTTIMEIGGASLTTNIVLTYGMFFLYFLNKRKFRKAKFMLPYALPFWLVMISMFFSCFTALSGFGTELMRMLTVIGRTYLIIWMAWDIFESKEDFYFLFKGITIVILACVLFGFIEYFLKDNPVLVYKVFLSDGDINIYNTASRRGYRMTSLFEHPIGTSMTLGLYAVFVFTVWVKGIGELPYKTLALITSLLCIPCVLLTKMRAGILFTVVAALSFINFASLKKKKMYLFIFLAILAAPIAYGAISENMSIILSIFNSQYQEHVGGSNSAMRLNQLEAVYHIMLRSPVFGLGQTFKGLLSNQYTEAALGYESVWFEQMSMHGIAGVTATIVLIYYTVVKIPKEYKSVPAFFFALAYWITYTLSSVPSFRVVLLFMAEFYFIKTSGVYRERAVKESKRPGIRFRIH